MKKITKISLIGICLIGLAIAYGFYSFGAPKEIPLSSISNESIKKSNEIKNFSFKNFTFEGFTLLGASHTGTFEKFKTTNTENFNGGNIVFETNSIKTDDAGLDEHLCANDMIDCAVNPTIEFSLQSTSKITDTNDLQAVGTLSFFGTTKNLSFNLTHISKNNYQADFLFNSLDFGFKYPKVDEKVRIQFQAQIQ